MRAFWFGVFFALNVLGALAHASKGHAYRAVLFALLAVWMAYEAQTSSRPTA